VADESLNIAICVPIDLSTAGGVETHINQLASALSALGHTVDCFDNITLKKGAKHIDTYDIINTHGCFFNRTVAKILKSKAPHQRHIHTLHGISLYYMINCRDWFNWRCYRAMFTERVMSRLADQVICVSNNIAEGAHKYFGITRQKLTVIGNGYNNKNIVHADATDEVKSNYNLYTNDIITIFVGRSEDKVKGSSLIYDTIKSLHKKNPNLKLIAVPGTNFPDAPWLIKTGKIPYDALPNLYKNAEIFINASLNEGAPLTLIEAMACGCAIIAAPVGGIPDIIVHQENGLLLKQNRSNLAECLQTLINNKTLRTQLSKRSKKEITHLTWDNIAKETAAVYLKAIDR